MFTSSHTNSWKHACIHACMHACMCLCIYIYISSISTSTYYHHLIGSFSLENTDKCTQCPECREISFLVEQCFFTKFSLWTLCSKGATMCKYKMKKRRHLICCNKSSYLSLYSFVDLFPIYLMRILVEDVGTLPRSLGPASAPSFWIPCSWLCPALPFSELWTRFLSRSYPFRKLKR